MYYQVGGPLKANHPTYVPRKADQELFDYLKNGEYCYVLNSRQMGKSSLAVQIRNDLEQEGIISVIVDLQPLGEHTQRNEFYRHIANSIMEFECIKQEFHDFNWLDYWKNIEGDASSKFRELLNKLLDLTKKSIIIFIDEIDAVRLLNFNPDDFFTYIRYCFNQRTLFTKLNRLTFCLIGLGTPADFIQNKSITSFNIGNAVDLTGLTFAESENHLITPNLEKIFGKDRVKDILKNIIEGWTNGQPFLTQKLCKLVLENRTLDLEDLVPKKIIQNWIEQDHPTHLRHIQDRILQHTKYPVPILELYKQILEQGEITADNSSRQMELRLCGLVMRKDGKIQPFNRIYREVFNVKWVNNALSCIFPFYQKYEAWSAANEALKQRYLLYGKDLENALAWVDSQEEKVTNKHHRFLTYSQLFEQKVKEKFPRGVDYQGIIDALFLWTGGVNCLNDFVFKIARTTFRKAITQGEEATEFETKLTIQKLTNDPDLQQHFNTISDRFFQDPTIDPFLLLSSYQEILQRESVDFNNSPEHQRLINMCIVIKEDNKLRILCKIYQRIFNEEWIKEQLNRLCPYSKAFHDWKTSQDEAHLLRGEDLQKALDWIQNKDPSDELEIKFIITSLVWEMWSSTEDLDQELKTQAVTNIEKWQSITKFKDNIYMIQKIIKETQLVPLLLEELLDKIEQKSGQEQPKSRLIQIYLKEIQKQHAINFLALLNNDINNNLETHKNQLPENYKQVFEQVNSWLNDDTKLREYLTTNIFNQVFDDFLEKLSRKFNNILIFVNELKLLTYDTINLEVKLEPQLDLIFGKEIKNMKDQDFQKEFDQLLDDIIENAKGSLQAILIFDLHQGAPLYHNKALKQNNPNLYHALFGEGVGYSGEAIENFSVLKGTKDAFNNFGEQTNFGNERATTIEFTQGIMRIYFYQMGDIPVAICFVGSGNANIGIIGGRSEKYIEKIREKLNQFF